MKKRILCFALVMLMVLGMVPVSAFAAVERTTSNAGIEAIKGFEGFEANEYTAGGKTYIGYGTQVTAGTYPSGITKTKAAELLKEDLDVIDDQLNAFASNNGLTLTQYQHDALASYSYNTGFNFATGNNALRTAVLNKADAEEMVRVFLQNLQPGGYFAGLVARRLKEANIFINGIYSAPANYTYAILDANGGTVDGYSTGKAVYGYIKTKSPDLNVTATKSGTDFMGWYDKDGNPVTVLDGSTAGQTLTARYGSGTADYEITGSQAANLSLYQSADPAAKKIGTLGKTTVYVVSQEKMVDGLKWVYVTQKNKTTVKGWVCLGEVNAEEESQDTVIAVATVTGSTLNVRESATTSSNSLGLLTQGDVVKVLAIKNVTTLSGTQSWGKIKYNGQYGWISLALTSVQEASSDENTTLVGATGTIVNAAEVNVRTGAGIASALKTTIKKGTKVTILDTKKVDGNMWAEVKWNGINTGWVYMHYISVGGTASDSSTSTNTVLYTGTVNSTINLNVRKSPNVSGALVTSLPTGTKINIYKTTTTNGVKWGYCDKGGWVCLQYVTLNATGNAGTEAPGTSGSAANGTVVNCATAVNIRATASVSAALVGTAPVGSAINIYEVKTVKGVEWGRSDKGWVCMQYVKLNTALPGNSSGTESAPTHVNGTVTSATLTIYKSPTNNSAEVGTMKKGDTAIIQEQKDESTALGTTKKWGKVTVDGITGWINLAYVNLELGYDSAPDAGNNDNTGSTIVSGTGVIANCVQVNVRSAAGVDNPLVTTLQAGTKVNIVEKVTVNNAPWAKISWNNGAGIGWACMYYITVDAMTGDNSTTTVPGTSTTVISATGIVNSNIDLNVRSGPGLGYAKVGSLAKGTKVSIYEQATADGMIWGKTSTGWVSMSYITIENTSSSGKGVMGTIARCHNAVNVRSAPGTGNALVGTIRVGTRVEIYEQTLYSGQYWGRVAQGWICMQYVLLDAELPPASGSTTPTTPTTPSTEDTTTTDPTTGVNTTGEVAYSISATVGASGINVRKDASADAAIAGSITSGKTLNILAIKTNGAEVWGRVDQYDIPGWILLSEVTLNPVNKFIGKDNTPVYATSSKSSSQIGALSMNTNVGNYQGLGLDGTTVMVKVSATISGITVTGWVEASALIKDAVSIPTTPDNTTENASSIFSGTTFAALTAYDAVGSSTVKFNLSNGATVYIQEITTEGGVIWGKVQKAGTTDVFGYINMSSVTINWSKNLTGEVNVRREPYGTEGDEIVDTLAGPGYITVSYLKLSNTGVLCGQIISTTATAKNGNSVNGFWVAMDNIV